MANPYKPMCQIADDLYCVDGWWKRSPMGRRMTVMGVGDGGLAVHSAIRMSDADMRGLDVIGRVEYVIVPNPFHASEAPWYAERYPGARVLVPDRLRRAQERRMRVDGTVADDWPVELAGRLEALSIEGLRLSESAYFHAKSRTLVLTDLVMNYGDDHFTGISRLLMGWNGVVDRFGPSRLLRFCFIKNRAQLLSSLERVMQWDFDRVLMNHGRILETAGKARLREAFAFLAQPS